MDDISSDVFLGVRRLDVLETGRRRRLFPQIFRGISGFAPVVVTPDCPAPSSRGQMEIVCVNGRRIIVDRDVDVAALLRVLAGLER